VRKPIRPVVAVTVAAALTLAMSGIAFAKTISNEKYAKKICGELNGVIDSIDKLKQPDASDPAAYQADALAAVDSLVKSLNKARATLKKVSPDDGEQKVSKLFDRYLKGFVTEFQKARDKFATADPASPAFSADVSVLGVSLQNASLKLDDPFSKLSGNQDLLGAFGDEKSCKQIVTVYGG
jgi:hypothetical protein